MPYEVELKFPVPDLAAVEKRLAELGAAVAASQEEVDLYFAHPARDFARSDEALRIRTIGAANYVTYKGPKIDRTTKTREEIELPLPGGPQGHADGQRLLEALGFRAVAEVRKRRRKARIAWQGREVEVSLDEVGSLGAFVELEIIASADGVESAKETILLLASSLGLAGSERRSYLELLLIRSPSGSQITSPPAPWPPIRRSGSP
jgi:adenylate cyclase class 2